MRTGFDTIGVTTPFYLIDEDGYLAVHRRIGTSRDEQGRWDPGSGQLEHGSTLEENALREVREEYGCEGEIVGKLPAHEIIAEQSGERSHWVVVGFFVRVNRADVRLIEPEKHADLRWCTLSELPRPLHRGFSTTLTRYRDEFSRFVRP